MSVNPSAKIFRQGRRNSSSSPYEFYVTMERLRFWTF